MECEAAPACRAGQRTARHAQTCNGSPNRLARRPSRVVGSHQLEFPQRPRLPIEQRIDTARSRMVFARGYFGGAYRLAQRTKPAVPDQARPGTGALQHADRWGEASPDQRHADDGRSVAINSLLTQ